MSLLAEVAARTAANPRGTEPPEKIRRACVGQQDSGNAKSSCAAAERAARGDLLNGESVPAQRRLRAEIEAARGALLDLGEQSLADEDGAKKQEDGDGDRHGEDALNQAVTSEYCSGAAREAEESARRMDEADIPCAIRDHLEEEESRRAQEARIMAEESRKAEDDDCLKEEARGALKAVPSVEKSRLVCVGSIAKEDARLAEKVEPSKRRNEQTRIVTEDTDIGCSSLVPKEQECRTEEACTAEGVVHLVDKAYTMEESGKRLKEETRTFPTPCGHTEDQAFEQAKAKTAVENRLQVRLAEDSKPEEANRAEEGQYAEEAKLKDEFPTEEETKEILVKENRFIDAEDLSKETEKGRLKKKPRAAEEAPLAEDARKAEQSCLPPNCSKSLCETVGVGAVTLNYLDGQQNCFSVAPSPAQFNQGSAHGERLVRLLMAETDAARQALLLAQANEDTDDDRQDAVSVIAASERSKAVCEAELMARQMEEEIQFAIKAHLAEENRRAEKARIAEKIRRDEEAHLVGEARRAVAARLAEEKRMAVKTHPPEDFRYFDVAKLAKENKFARQLKLEEMHRARIMEDISNKELHHAAGDTELFVEGDLGTEEDHLNEEKCASEGGSESFEEKGGLGASVYEHKDDQSSELSLVATGEATSKEEERLQSGLLEGSKPDGSHQANGGQHAKARPDFEHSAEYECLLVEKPKRAKAGYHTEEANFAEEVIQKVPHPARLAETTCAGKAETAHLAIKAGVFEESRVSEPEDVVQRKNEACLPPICSNDLGKVVSMGFPTFHDERSCHSGQDKNSRSPHSSSKCSLDCERLAQLLKAENEAARHSLLLGRYIDVEGDQQDALSTITSDHSRAVCEAEGVARQMEEEMQFVMKVHLADEVRRAKEARLIEEARKAEETLLTGKAHSIAKACLAQIAVRVKKQDRKKSRRLVHTTRTPKVTPEAANRAERLCLAEETKLEHLCQDRPAKDTKLEVVKPFKERFYAEEGRLEEEGGAIDECLVKGAHLEEVTTTGSQEERLTEERTSMKETSNAMEALKVEVGFWGKKEEMEEEGRTMEEKLANEYSFVVEKNTDEDHFAERVQTSAKSVKELHLTDEKRMSEESRLAREENSVKEEQVEGGGVKETAEVAGLNEETCAPIDNHVVTTEVDKHAQIDGEVRIASKNEANDIHLMAKDIHLIREEDKRELNYASSDTQEKRVEEVRLAESACIVEEEKRPNELAEEDLEQLHQARFKEDASLIEKAVKEEARSAEETFLSYQQKPWISRRRKVVKAAATIAMAGITGAISIVLWSENLTETTPPVGTTAAPSVLVRIAQGGRELMALEGPGTTPRVVAHHESWSKIREQKKEIGKTLNKKWTTRRNDFDVLDMQSEQWRLLKTADKANSFSEAGSLQFASGASQGDSYKASVNLQAMFKSHPMGAYYAAGAPPHDAILTYEKSAWASVPFVGMGIGDGY